MSMDHNRLYRWTTKNDTMSAQKEADAIEGIEPGVMEMKEEQDAGAELAEAREKASKNMPPTMRQLLGFRQNIKDKNYEFGREGHRSQAKRETKDTGYMHDILVALGNLENELNGTVSTDEKAVETVQNAFLDVVAACEIYIEKRTGFFAGPWSAEGKARKQMVQDFREQVMQESIRFSDRVSALAAQKGEGLLGEERKWFDIIDDIRTEKFVDGEDGVKITMGGEGTSELYIIEKNGEKTFFKESEKIPSDSLGEHLSAEVALLDKKIAETKGSAGERAIHTRRRDLLQGITRFMGVDNLANLENRNAIIKQNHPQKMFELINGAFSGEIGKKMKAMKQEYADLAEEAKGVKTAIEQKQAEKEREKDPVRIARLESEIDELEQRRASIKQKMTDSDYYYIESALWRVRRKVLSNNIACNAVQMEEGSEISKRNVATSRMAKLLKIDDMVVESGMTEITVGDKKLRGIRMKEAKGDTIAHHLETVKKTGGKLSYSSNALKQLMTLQVFDLICGQTDRNVHNYLSVMEKDPAHPGDYLITKITAIDNDMCFGKREYYDIENHGEDGVAAMKNIVIDGEITLPAMDNDFANNILAIEPATLDYLFVDLLSKAERAALVDRFTHVQRIINEQKQREKKPNAKRPVKSLFVQDEEGWKQKTEELGKTYAAKTEKNKKKLEKISYLDIKVI